MKALDVARAIDALGEPTTEDLIRHLSSGRDGVTAALLSLDTLGWLSARVEHIDKGFRRVVRWRLTDEAARNPLTRESREVINV